MDIKFWQTRINITQIPSSVETQEIINYETERPDQLDKTWLYDPFLDRTVYGLELTINDQSLTWTFFLCASSKIRAIKRGHAFLMYLEQSFPGLSGEVNVVPITSSILSQNYPIYEFVLPRRPYELDKFMIIDKFVHLFHKNEGYFIQLFIFWQRDDSIDHLTIPPFENAPYEHYKVKLFIRLKNNESEQDLWKLEGMLDFLTINIQNLLRERAKLEKVPDSIWQNILSHNVFWVNSDRLWTGRYYRRIIERIPSHRVPAFITPFQVDFTFSEDLPLSKAISLPIENIDYSQTDGNKEYISIGKVVVKGVSTTIIKKLPIHHFANSVFVGGQTGTGKTFFLGHVCKEIHDKYPDVGILIINLGKGRQEKFYPTDEVIKYGSPNLRVSYFYEGEHLVKSLQETASYLIASLGLKNPCDKIMFGVMKSFLKVNKTLPSSLITLFNGLKKWFKERPYDRKYQTNILRAIQNRVLTLLSDPTLDGTLRLPHDSKIPQWYLKWRMGETIYIDLSMCNIYVKRLLTSAIFQMVKTLLPDMEAGKLEDIILIDEAHQIAERPITTNPDDDDFISREQLEIILNTLIREFRSKGLSLIFADPHPSRLFNSILTIPSLKILFRLSHMDNRLFTNNLELQEYLILLKKRRAVVLNGNNEEIFTIETLDYLSK